MRSSRSSLACFLSAATITIAETLGCSGFLTAAEPAAPVGRPGETLVKQALAAEADGNATQRAALLSQALASEPDNAQARWADGQVSFGGQWRALETIEQTAAHDPKLIQYRELRSKKTGTMQTDQSLAVWCEQHKLDAEARSHWRHVLELDPGKSRAIKALDLHLYHEELLTSAELAERQRAASVLQKATEHWRPKLAGWRRDLESKSDLRCERARTSIQAIDDIGVIPVFESLLQRKSIDNTGPAFSLEFVSLLAKLNDRRSVEALVRQATSSNWPGSRSAAISKLSKLELMQYVPYAMSCMHLPLRREFSISINDDGYVQYEQRLSAEGAEVGDYHVVRRHFQIFINSPLRMPDEYAQLAQYQLNGSVSKPASTVAEVVRQSNQDASTLAEQNQLTAFRNEMTHQLLLANTGADCPATPEAWWEWWRQYNELSIPADKVQRFSYDWRYLPPGHCCFAAGTKVSTITGLAPIEQIQRGDRVLAQNPETGELAYKVVSATTIRPPSALRRLDVGGESILTTRGHRFWEIGRGWQMSKHLESGQLLHCVKGAQAIEDIADADDDQAYNLVVEDFHTYFVGEHRILVHDNSAPKPVLGPVPGISIGDR